MDLILWRHAEAKDPDADTADLERRLTAKGQEQAARMAAWLQRHLPRRTRVLCSPARRAVQTAKALRQPFKSCRELGPQGSVANLLAAAGWPTARRAVLVVGHQPTLGQTLAQLLGIEAGECPFRKGTVWWLRSRVRAGVRQTVVISVQTPEML